MNDLPAHVDIEKFRRAATAHRSGGGLNTVCAATLHGRDVPRREFHVDDLLPANTVTLLAGDGGTGKSLLALQLCVATCLGLPWLGRQVRQGPALYLGAEDDLDEMHRRLDAITADLGVTIDQLGDLHIVPLAGEDAVLATAGKGNVVTATPLWQQLEHTVTSIRPRCTAFDTLADLFAGDENSRTQARQFVGMLRGLAIRHHTTALLLAHPSLTGLNSGSGTSGSTAWSNSVRSRLYLDRITEQTDKSTFEPDPNLRVLRTMKANYGPTGGEITLRWDNGVFRQEGSGQGFLDRLAQEHTVEERFLELLRAVRLQGRHVNHAGGPNYAPKVFAATDTKIGHREFRAAMDRLFASNRIKAEPFGPPSKGTRHIVETT